MPVIFEPATSDVLELACEIIGSYHPMLREARIGFVFRSEVQTSKDHDVWAAISTVPPKVRAAIRGLLGAESKEAVAGEGLMGTLLDYLVWIAKPIWEIAPDSQRRALLDHELSHARYGQSGWTTRGHDVEEFLEVIQRHGLWNTSLRHIGAVIQQQLPGIEPRGAVVAANPALAQATLTYNGRTVDMGDTDATRDLLTDAVRTIVEGS
jgi:hypothetical protein